MYARLETVLTRLAQKDAQHLLLRRLPEQDRRRGLAEGLAAAGLLVIVAEVPAQNQPDKASLISEWTSIYASLYALLTGALFPSFTKVEAVYADQQDPAIIVLKGESKAVIRSFAGYITPYVAVRQQSRGHSSAELRGVMTFLLDALEADDLPRQKYNQVVEAGMQALNMLLSLPLRQIALTDFAEPIFEQMPDIVPPAQPKPAQPPHLPEEGPALATRDFFAGFKAIPFDRRPLDKPEKGQTQRTPGGLLGKLRPGDET